MNYLCSNEATLQIEILSRTLETEWVKRDFFGCCLIFIFTLYFTLILQIFSPLVCRQGYKINEYKNIFERSRDLFWPFMFFCFLFQLSVFHIFLIISSSFATYGCCHPCLNQSLKQLVKNMKKNVVKGNMKGLCN